MLTGCENYAIWSRAIMFSLEGKNKLGFVEGFVLSPDDLDFANK